MLRKITYQEIESRLKAIGFDLSLVPDRLLDPVTLDFPLINPVFCNDGRTYNLTSYTMIQGNSRLSASNSQLLIKIKDNDDIFEEIEDFISSQEFKYLKAQKASAISPLKTLGFFPDSDPVKISPRWRDSYLKQLRELMQKEWSNDLAMMACALAEERDLRGINLKLQEILNKYFKPSDQFVGGIVAFLFSENYLFIRYINQLDNAPLRNYLFELVQDYFFTKSLHLTKPDEWHHFLFHWGCLLDQAEFLNNPEIRKIDPNLMTGMRVRNWSELPLLQIRALHLSAQVGALNSLAYLIKQGARIDDEACGCETALTFAVKERQLCAFKLLLNAGAKLLPPSREKCLEEHVHQEDPSPLMIAATKNFPELAECCLNHYKVQFSEEMILAAAMRAGFRDHQDTLRVIYPQLTEKSSLELMATARQYGCGKMIVFLETLKEEGVVRNSYRT